MRIESRAEARIRKSMVRVMMTMIKDHFSLEVPT